ncbi:MAG: hypothetical protein QS721_01455 [Candidatus Endonucleobacter sp. (ex Gigantidas childressi)]|nr:hypothetical protein [Candidatus Endonucleobacter sp. (ex Gigantidas childressi)]
MKNSDINTNPTLAPLTNDDDGSNFSAIIEPDLRAELKKELKLNDNELNAWLAIADKKNSDNCLSPLAFATANKDTLIALQKSKALSNFSKSLVAARTPVAMMSEVSNPRNWKKDVYIGPGAMAVNAFLHPMSTNTLPLDDMDPPIDPTNISLDALVMSILTQRAEILEVQLQGQIGDIQKKNEELEEANVWLTRAKEQKANAGTSGSTFFTPEFISYWKSLGAEHQTSTRLEIHFVDPAVAGLYHNSGDWDVNIEGLKGKVEALTSQSQLETTKLQQTINKYNQSFDMLSNFINKYYQSIGTIIQNIK